MSELIGVKPNEEARLNALRDLQLLDTPPSESFDRLTRLASRLLAAPVSTISLTDGDRQWFKSKVGVDIHEIPREQAPCSYAIEGNGVFVVRDLNDDSRFVGSPLAQAGIRFYAGAPLFTRAGYGLGTICVVDAVARDLRDGEAELLTDLAGMVMSQIELQNLVGRVDAGTGQGNQYQLFEDLDDLARWSAGEPAVALSIDLLSASRATKAGRVLGSDCVNSLLQEAIARLQLRGGNSARVYHVGPTRCAMLVENGLLEGYELAAQCRAALEPSIFCEGVPVALDPVVGVYDFVIGEVSPREVFKRVSVAGDDARETPSGRARYDAASDQRDRRSFALLNDFASALEARDQLSLLFQPRIALADASLVGVEALLRWRHPSLGSVAPGEFVPLVEQTALARPMTDWVVAAAVRQCAAWQVSSLATSVSINASALNLEEPDFAERFLATAEALGVSPELLELEFTESAVARDSSRVAGQLRKLRSAGVEIAIDDFGTGYSNLSYLQQLPVTVLKIDQAFVRQIGTSGKDRLLVKTMIAMGHDLGYRVVAEGIETQPVYDLLAEWGCDQGQGYLMSRPIAASAVHQTPVQATWRQRH